MTQNIAEPGNPEPGPDSFDFDKWLSDEHSFPVFDHTIYLDQRSGVRLADLCDERDELIGNLTRLDEEIEERRTSGASSLVDPEMDKLLERRESLAREGARLQKLEKELQERIRRSGVTLYFEVKTPEELGAITRQADRKFLEENPQHQRSEDGDLDYVTARTRNSLAAQISHFCVGVENSKGDRIDGLTHEQADRLLRKLIAPEMMRLMEKMGTKLSAMQEWADKVNDAGFPGRGTDVVEVGARQDGAEVGESLGGSAAHDAARQGTGLV